MAINCQRENHIKWSVKKIVGRDLVHEDEVEVIITIMLT